MLFYVYDINAILEDPLKNRTEGEMTKAYCKRMDYLRERGFTPKVHFLDNETVKGIQEYDKENGINFIEVMQQREPLELGRIIFSQESAVCTSNFH